MGTKIVYYQVQSFHGHQNFMMTMCLNKLCILKIITHDIATIVLAINIRDLRLRDPSGWHKRGPGFIMIFLPLSLSIHFSIPSFLKKDTLMIGTGSNIVYIKPS